jgi:hypothetical protein
MLAALPGCHGRAVPAAAPRAEAPAPLTFVGHLDVELGGYHLAACTDPASNTFGGTDYRSDCVRSLKPYEADQIATVVVSLYAKDTAGDPYGATPVATSTFRFYPAGINTFTLGNLKHDTHYRVVAEAYNAASQLINATPSSLVEFDTVATAATGLYTTGTSQTVPVRLLDQPFSGSLDVTREIGEGYHGMLVELHEARADGTASGDAIASADLVGTGVGQVTFERLDYNKAYVVRTRKRAATGPLTPIDATDASAVVRVDDYASASQVLATLTLPLEQ